MVRNESQAMTQIHTPANSFEVAAQQLHLRQAELRTVLQDAAGAAVHAVDQPTELSDFKEVADDDAQDTLSDVATRRALRELADVEAALRRIREGSYGVCAECGDAIAAARLLAVPAAALCAACQEQQERQLAQRG